MDLRGAIAKNAATVAVAGHKLETVSTRGGIAASCSCGKVYTPPTGRSQVFPTWQRDKIKEAHKAHLAEVTNQ